MTPHPFDDIPSSALNVPSSRKWSLNPDTIGAWVAEMDYGTAPAVGTALHAAIDGGVLGYLSPAIANEMAAETSRYMREQYSWDVAPEHVHPVSDVMAALGVAISQYTPRGTAVIVPTPAYMPFLSFPPTRNRSVIEVPGIVENGRWRHDLDAIDAAFTAGAKTFVLCNPHNPTGTVFDRAELEAIAEVVERNGGRVFADEIHAPLRFDGREHIPYASISPAAAAHTITGTSASKAWNIPGLKAAQLITSNHADAQLYRSFGFAVQHGASTLGVVATTAAYRDGHDWLAEVVDYLDGNRRLLGSLLAELAPAIGYEIPDATYIAWLDCRELGIPGSPAAFFREHAGITVTDGELCGRGYEGFVRFVFAMPRPILEESVRRIAAAVATL